MGAGDAGGILVDVKIHVHVPELRPGDADPLAVELHLVAIAFLEQVGHQADQDVGVDGLALLGAGMHLQLEACQGGHDEEVAVVVRHGLFDQADLEIGSWSGCRTGGGAPWPG